MRGGGFRYSDNFRLRFGQGRISWRCDFSRHWNFSRRIIRTHREATKSGYPKADKRDWKDDGWQFAIRSLLRISGTRGWDSRTLVGRNWQRYFRRRYRRSSFTDWSRLKIHSAHRRPADPG